MTASAAARRMSSGPGSSGKPWPRLMALLSRASCDIASKMVTGRSAKTLFMELMSRSAAGPGRQSRRLPGQHATRQMLVVGQPRGLGGQRRRYRPFAGTAGENHLLAVGIGNLLRVETGKRDHHRVRIGFHGNLVRLADVDHKVAAFGHALCDIFRRQIVNLARHVVPPKDWSERIAQRRIPVARPSSSTPPLLRRKTMPGRWFVTPPSPRR